MPCAVYVAAAFVGLRSSGRFLQSTDPILLRPRQAGTGVLTMNAPSVRKIPSRDPQLNDFAVESARDDLIAAENSPPYPGRHGLLTLPTGPSESAAHNDVMVEKEEPKPGQHAESAVSHPRPPWAELYRGGARRVAGLETEWVPAWLRPTGPENRLPGAASMVVAIALQISLSSRFSLHPRWLLPLLEVALLVVLTAINPVRLSRPTRVGRYLTMALAGAITLAPWRQP